MREKTTRPAAVLLCAAALVSLCACGGGGITAEDATKCVQVELDATYKGKFDGFVNFYSNMTTQDGKDQYDANVEAEAGYFLESFGVPSLEDEDQAVEPKKMQRYRAEELYQDIYAKANYTVASSTKQEDGTFAVKVNVKPMDILQRVDDAWEEGFEDFWAKYEAVDAESMSDEEFTDWYTGTFAEAYYDVLLDLLESQIPDTGYQDERSIVIQVQQDEDGSLFISDDDWINLDNLIIDYQG